MKIEVSSPLSGSFFCLVSFQALLRQANLESTTLLLQFSECLNYRQNRSLYTFSGSFNTHKVDLPRVRAPRSTIFTSESLELRSVSSSPL